MLHSCSGNVSHTRMQRMPVHARSRAYASAYAHTTVSGNNRQVASYPPHHPAQTRPHRGFGGNGVWGA